MTKTELQVKRAKAWDDCKAFLESHRNDNGVLNAEDNATYDKMVAIVDEIGAEIDRMEAIEAREKAMLGGKDPVVDNPSNGDPVNARESKEYRNAFVNYIRTKKASNALQEDTNSEGGYLVPLEFERVLYHARDKVDPIFALAGKLVLNAKEKAVPYVASEGAATLIAEEGSYGDTDDSFGQVVFRAYKFGRICKASDELIADSAFDISAHLAESFGRAIGKAEAGYFWTGTGSNQPQGVMAAAGTGVTTAAANKITADEIIDLYYSLPEEYRDGAVFVFNDATVKEIRKLKDGNGQYIWAPGFNGQPDTLLGKPLHTSAYIDTIAATKKVGVFANLAECYKIADRSGFEFKVLNELYAANGQVGFRGTGRTDGKALYGSTGIKALVMHA